MMQLVVLAFPENSPSKSVLYLGFKNKHPIGIFPPWGVERDAYAPGFARLHGQGFDRPGCGYAVNTTHTALLG